MLMIQILDVASPLLKGKTLQGAQRPVRYKTRKQSEPTITMKAISTTHGISFFNTASASALTGTWSVPFPAEARHRETAASVKRAARRQLRSIDAEGSLWQETAARVVLGLVMVSAYVTAIWQIGSF